MAYDVFVSYSQHDKLVADAIVARLEQDGTRCWIAPRDITPGTSWGDAIVQAIGECRVMVLVLSGESNRSRQVVREVERAVAGDVIILPFRIENIDPTGAMAYFLGTEHWLDALTPPVERHIERLTSTVGTLLAGGPVAREDLDTPPPAVTRKARPRWLPITIAVVAAIAALAVVLTIAGGGTDSTTTTAAAAPTTVPTTTAPSTSTTTSTTTTIPVGLEEVGRFKPFDTDPTDLQPAGLVYGFDIDGTTAMVANGIDGVLEVSIGSAEEPRPVKSFGIEDAQDVAYGDGTVFAVSGEFATDVWVFPDDGSGGSAVTWEGTRPTVSHIEEANGFAYLGGHNYIGIIDGTDPSDPNVIWEWEPPGSTGNPAHPVVADDVGYFASGWDGLYVFDLANPGDPQLLGHWASPNWIIDVKVDDDVAYVSLGDTGVAVIDVSNPAAISMLGLAEVPGFASRLDVAADHVFVTWFGDGGGLGGIAVVDVSDSENPEFVETFGRHQSLNGLQVVDGHVYVTDETEGMVVYRITGVG